MTHSKIEMAMAVEVLDKLGYSAEDLLDRMIRVFGWQDHTWWIRGVLAYHEGEPSDPGGEVGSREEAVQWMEGWVFAHGRDPDSEEY